MLNIYVVSLHYMDDYTVDLSDRFKGQFLSFRHLNDNRYIWRADISDIDMSVSEETSEFYYCETGYQVLDLYCDLSEKEIKQGEVTSLFKDISMTFLILQRGDVDFNGLKSVFNLANIRLLRSKNLGLSDDHLTNVLTDSWNDYNCGDFYEYDYIKTKYFKVKSGVNLSLAKFRSLIAVFFNNKRYDKMIQNVEKLKLLIKEWIGNIDGFISADRVADRLGVKLPTANKYINMTGMKDKITEYHLKYFKTNRKDNYDTFKGIKSAGYEIHYEEYDIITQLKVSDKIDKPLITVSKNWKPHKEEFNKLNKKLKDGK